MLTTNSKTTGILILVFIVFLSILVVILPTFLPNNQSRVSINQTIELDHILNQTQTIELIFFGYTGCMDICTPRLLDLANWYEQLPQTTQNKINVRFFDLKQATQEMQHTITAKRNMADLFAKSFHKNFIGYSLNKFYIRNYTKAFFVYFSQSLINIHEINHSSNLYLVKRDNTNNKEIRFIYNAYPFNFQQISSDIKGLMNE